MRLFCLLAALLGCVLGARAQEDYVLRMTPQGRDSLAVEWQHNVDSRNWVQQLWHNGFHINDPDVRYPKFARFCVSVYNWGDRTFNSYDPEYVVGTGKNWKLYAKNSVWGCGYMMLYDNQKPFQLRTNVYSDLGAHLSFMAVSIGRDFNTGKIFGRKYDRASWDFGFTCSRFAASVQSRNTNGGMRIIRFGDYKNGKRLNIPFEDISVDMFQADAYYFLNNKKYSQAAAYCFSKYQIKSAGSPIVGFSYSHHRYEMDFGSLPMPMQKVLEDKEPYYLFNHDDYNLMLGYGYNFVFKPKVWLLNITVLPEIGYKHSKMRRDDDPAKSLLSTNLKGMFSIVYNHRALFVSAQLNATGYVNYSSRYTYFTATGTGWIFAGLRF